MFNRKLKDRITQLEKEIQDVRDSRNELQKEIARLEEVIITRKEEINQLIGKSNSFAYALCRHNATIEAYYSGLYQRSATFRLSFEPELRHPKGRNWGYDPIRKESIQAEYDLIERIMTTIGINGWTWNRENRKLCRTYSNMPYHAADNDMAEAERELQRLINKTLEAQTYNALAHTLLQPEKEAKKK